MQFDHPLLCWAPAQRAHLKGAARAATVVLFTLITLLGTSCFDNPKPDCGFGCGPNDECPSDYVCNSEKRCQLESAPDAVCPGTENQAEATSQAAPAAH